MVSKVSHKVKILASASTPPIWVWLSMLAQMQGVALAMQQIPDNSSASDTREHMKSASENKPGIQYTSILFDKQLKAEIFESVLDIIKQS